VPTPIETTVPGYASCYDPRCPGYEQERVNVLRREVLFMREEFGGDIPGVDHSTITAVDESVSLCPHCGGPRIASLEERPEYPPMSGQHPLALLDLNDQKLKREQALVNAQNGQQMAELMALVQSQRAEMAEMKAELQRRRGGRPPKEDPGE
jgi:cytochrome c553